MRSHLRPDLVDEWRALDGRAATLLAGPGGSGKTTLARTWRERLQEAGRATAWLALAPLHTDPVVLVEDLVHAIRSALPEPLDEYDGFGTQTLRALPSIGTSGAHVLARSLSRALRGVSGSLFVFLDGFDHMTGKSTGFELVDDVLRGAPPNVHWILTSRGLRPDAWPRLEATAQAIEIGADALALRTDQVRQMLRDARVQLDEVDVARLLARTEGWPIAVGLAARALGDVPREDHARFIDNLVEQEDLFRYITGELVARIEPVVQSALENASLLGRVERHVLAASLEGADGSRAIDEALRLGLLSLQEGRLVVHDLLADWLTRRLRERSTPEDWRTRHAALGRIAEQHGLGIETLALYADAESPDDLADVLERRGSEWFQLGHHEHIEAALSSLPETMRRERPSLIALEGLLASGRDPDRAIECLGIAIEHYSEAGDRAAEYAALHELGIVAMNENRMGEVRAVYRQALSVRRVAIEPRLRGVVLMALGAGSFVAGRYSTALRLLATADGYDLPVQERGGVGLLRGSILFHRGEWDRVVSEIEARCEDPEQRIHGTSFHVMEGLRSLVLGLRHVDLPGARMRLTEASEFFGLARRSLSQLRIELARGQLARCADDPAAGLEHFERAASIGARIRLAEAEAAALGLLARTQQQLGDDFAAATSARQALALLRGKGTWSSRWGSSPFWATGLGLAAVVLAECGDAPAASGFFAKHRRRILHRELPLCAHAIHWMHARVAHLAGDEKTSQRALQAASALEPSGGVSDLAPEVDDALATWARSARAASSKAAATVPTSAPGSDFTLSTFGGLRLERGQRDIADRDWRGTVTRRLLTRILVAEGEAIPRERIEAELWPEATAASAGNSLRVTLSRLRDVLEPRRRKGATSAYLRIEGDRIAATESLLERWDVTRWRTKIAELETSTEAADIDAARRVFEEACAIGRERLLPEIYDEAVCEYARAIDRRWLSLLAETSAAWCARGEPEFATKIAEAALARDGLDETAWSRVVEARLAAGDRGGARRAIDEARSRLESELGSSPGPELVALEKRLVEGAP